MSKNIEDAIEDINDCQDVEVVIALAIEATKAEAAYTQQAAYLEEQIEQLQQELDDLRSRHKPPYLAGHRNMDAVIADRLLYLQVHKPQGVPDPYNQEKK